MKKIVTITFLAVALFFIAAYFSASSKAETSKNTDRIAEIEKFSALDEEEQIKVEEILMEKDFGKKYSIALFKNKEGIGYAILENDNLVLVSFGNNRQEYDQFKNFYIVYGENPQDDYQELKITIEMGNNYENLEEVITLDEGKYYLHVKELPINIKGTKVFSDNYIFN
ncbi:hypothetical protein [Ornithinibacillus bavariensis]|uniref:hypothetical protein n=1 Tax=Ornithinibacillus bavariensis TaxID=545502 RepID=UPI000EBD8718|nr:hypothetical protein [Ornithinibacillus sp.]